MSLQSQAPRSGGSRRYMARRRKSKLPWLALFLLAAGVVGLYFYFNDDAGGAGQASANTGDTDNANTTDTGSQDNPASAPVPDRTAQAAGQQRTIRASNTTPTQTERSTTSPQQTPQHHLASLVESSDTKLTGEAKDQYELGLRKLGEGDLVTGRALLSELLFRPGTLNKADAAEVRRALAEMNKKLVFSRERVPRDTITLGHTVQSGEYLSTIANTYKVPYQLLERINNMKAVNLQAGSTIKVLRGPVHARVDKSDYRMDLYVEDPNGLKIYLKSYTIGLGEFDSTPVGLWRIKLGSKVGPENGGPSWRNPRTGQSYDRNDPDIPIGEYWMALEGMDENTKNKTGYGIHATNDPESIGRQESMGCIRMRDEDVDEVFYTLYEVRSRVEIVP